ncbi:hypothetical protein CQA53_10890 [Helicobacter didelphidarum]|uniref:Type VI secretion system amidase effector protein Tae4 n=2 Tax=Helicobacter didelphidarum TaxID=2040648 RepID=A0A3D8I5X3_9HELI|nr:hypothetical protein CQA53_10890 [Helicobacter didelphidarum]
MGKLEEAIKKQLIIYKIKQEYAKEILVEIKSTLDNFNQHNVYPRYAKVGGKVLEEYARFIINDIQIRLKYESERYQNFANSCALQVSYAFNNGKMPIKSLCTLPSNALRGDDGHLYYTGVPKIKELLLRNWKQVKPFSKNNTKDFYKVFYTDKNIARDENKKFFATLQSLHQNGIITMDIDGWRDAGGHTTLWDKEMGGFLDETNYLNDETIVVRELCFWKI